MNHFSPSENFSTPWIMAALSTAYRINFSILTCFIPKKLFLCFIIYNHINDLFQNILQCKNDIC